MQNPAAKSLGRLQDRKWNFHLADYGFIAAFFILLLIASTMTDVFFTQRNLSNLFRRLA